MDILTRDEGQLQTSDNSSRLRVSIEELVGSNIGSLDSGKCFLADTCDLYLIIFYDAGMYNMRSHRRGGS